MEQALVGEMGQFPIRAGRRFPHPTAEAADRRACVPWYAEGPPTGSAPPHFAPEAAEVVLLFPRSDSFPRMNLPDVLNVAIGLIVLYFLLSTVASALAEIAGNLLRYREEILIVTVNRLLTGLDDIPWSKRRLLWDRLLEEIAKAVPGRALKDFIRARRPGPTPLPSTGDAEADRVNESFVRGFWAHARIRNLTPVGSDAPASLEPATFSQVVIDLAISRDSAGALPNTRAALERRLSARARAAGAPVLAPEGTERTLVVSTRVPLVPESLRRSLRVMGLSSTIPVDAAGESLWSQFEANVASWFKEGMGLATERYRRIMRHWLLWIGLALAAALNADTIRIVYVLSQDKDLAARVAVYAETVRASGETSDTQDRQGLQEEKERLRASLQRVQALDRIGFPIGWRYRPAEDFLPSEAVQGDGNLPGLSGNLAAWVLKLLGLLLTATAVSLGAPFWYDMLNKMVSLRKPAGGLATTPAPALAAAAGAVTSSVKSAILAQGALEIGHDLARAGHGFDPRKAYWLAVASELAYAPRAEIERVVRTDWSFSDLECWDVHTEQTDTQAFAISDGAVAVVAFRGTEPKVINDVLTDARFRQNPFSSDPGLADMGAVHRGFAGAISDVYEPIVAWLISRWAANVAATEHVLYVTGHSLGGALATMFAARVATDPRTRTWRFQLYTYGCPLVGNRVFAEHFDRLTGGRVFRCVHALDAVTQVPPRALGFSHVGQMLHFTKPDGLRREVSSLDRLLDLAVAGIEDLRQAAREAIEDHGMANYVQRCRQAAEETARAATAPASPAGP